jgi:hypothetical protein
MFVGEWHYAFGRFEMYVPTLNQKYVTQILEL